MNNDENSRLFVRSKKLPNDIDNNGSNDLSSSSEKQMKMLDLNDFFDEEEQQQNQDRDFQLENSKNSLESAQFRTRFVHRSKSIDLKTAKTLKRLLIGIKSKNNSSFGPEWRDQYFCFDDVPWYGLVQNLGGPCGVLAAIQGYLCAEFFYYQNVDIEDRKLDLRAYRLRCLARAIGQIFWQIGGPQKHVVVAFECSRQRFIDDDIDFFSDGITEHLRLCQFNSHCELNEFVEMLLLEPSGSYQLGCVSFVYSCILTRGLDQIEQDYDNESIQSLLVTETYLCTQELVNLFLIGRAVSNVFDSTMNCDRIVLQGITRQSTIGFLTLHEYYGMSRVGSCYKNPKLLIYVVLSEGHFTVLFSKDKPKSERLERFHLFHYDGLMHLNQECCLTIDINDDDHNQDNDSPVPLECVIRTRWPRAHIDWNNSAKLF